MNERLPKPTVEHAAKDSERDVEKRRAELGAEFDHRPEQKLPDAVEAKARANELAQETASFNIEGGSENSRPSDTVLHTKDYKNQAFQRSLEQVRSSLKPVGRIFSRVVHLPVVEKTSELAAKSIGRPSVSLGAPLIAFIGFLYLYSSAKTYGYELNHFVLFLLFAIGGAVGLLAEVIFKTIMRHRR